MGHEPQKDNMATQSEIEALYDWVHFFHTLRSGDYADFSCAFFDGNFNQTLVAAQKAKHQWALDGLRFQSADRILDVGCGWGPVLNAVRMPCECGAARRSD